LKILEIFGFEKEKGGSLRAAAGKKLNRSWRSGSKGWRIE